MEVKDYVLQRLMILVPTLIGISILTFFLTRLAGSPIGLYVSRFAPQDVIERVKEVHHLNDPVWMQYLYWLRDVLHGNLGWSAQANKPVAAALLQLAPATFELAVAGIIIAMAISITLGTLAGRYPDSWIDNLSRVAAVGGMSTPQFWAGLMLVFVGYVALGLFPIGRANSAVWGNIAHPTGVYTLDAILAGNLRALRDAVWHLLLPAFTIGYAESAVITRHLRSEIIEKSREEYVDAARARGVHESLVYRKHIRRNALIPTLTVAGLSFAFLVRGIIVVELVFAWPGMGRFVANAALTGDYASIMGFILVVSLLVLLINLLVDVGYAYLDPRIELGE
ncbi:MAG: ABC transporter permease [Salinigranum sp.]